MVQQDDEPVRPSPLPWKEANRIREGGVWICSPDGFIIKVFGNSPTSKANARVIVGGRFAWSATQTLWALLRDSNVDWSSDDAKQAAAAYEEARKQCEGTEW